VAAGSKPDLIDPGPVRAFVPNDEVLPGGAVSIQMSVKNAGTSSAGTFVIKYYLSEDSTFTTTDPFLCALEVGGAGMVPGETRNFTVQGQIPSNTSPGLYRVWWFIDVNNSVSELKENNNKIQAEDGVDNRLLVQGPDFTSGGVGLLTPSLGVVPGKSASVTLRVRNEGELASTAPLVNIDYYLSADTVLNVAFDQKISTKSIRSFPGSSFSFIPALTTAVQDHLVKIPSTIIPPVLGENYLLYSIDPPSSSEPRGRQNEINETNNVGAIGPFNIVSACDQIDLTTARDFFTEAVQDISANRFCHRGEFSSFDQEMRLWNPSNAFMKDYNFFYKQNQTLNGRFCSDKFAAFYTRWETEVSNLLSTLKSACTNIHQIDFQYVTLQGAARERVVSLAERFVAEFAALKTSCNSGGVLQPLSDKRVYCGCPDTNYLKDLPGIDPGTSDCLLPN
jgi:CARDB